MYEEFVRQMKNEKTAKGRKKIIVEMCKLFAISSAKAYKELAAAGWESGRKRRKDAGESSITADQLKTVALMLKRSMRKNGKAVMSVNVARSILQSRGEDIQIGDSRLRELLREYNLAVVDAKQRQHHQRMQSEYPNQVHFADPSVSLIWFAPNGKQKIVGDDEQYKNKNFLEGKVKCWRYVLTDHYSSSICVRYFAAMGETAENMYNFLLYAWGLKDDPLYIFHGLPEMLIWDKGSANIAKAVSNALAALRVKTNTHLPGNPRAKGQVEKANDIVEKHFESRLRFEPVASIEELNDAAERWCAAYNANMIEGLDTRLTRHAQKIGSRLMLWQKIKAEQIRELPEKEICRQIFTSGIQPRKVGGDLAISFMHPKIKQVAKYSVAALPGILVGQELNVQAILVDDKPLVNVSYKYNNEIVSYEIEPIAYNEMGFDIDAPVYGKNYKRQKDTIREKNAKELDALGSANGPAHSFINAETPFIKQRTGTQINISVPEKVTIHDILIGHIEAAKRIKARLGYLPEGIIDYLKANYKEGVPSGEIDNIASDFEAGIDNTALSL